jgi:hypothetical protein
MLANLVPVALSGILIGVLAFRVHIILLNELPVVIIGFRFRLCPRHLTHPIRSSSHRSLARRSLLCDRVASVDPVRVDINRRR